MANKPQANHGDIAEYRHQGKAIWSNGVRLSGHEHVEAHINLVKQTTNRETGQTSYDKGAYRHSVTITIPRDMAVEKTKLDMQLRDKLKAAWESGEPIDDKLMQELGPEAAIQRTAADLYTLPLLTGSGVLLYR